MLLENWSKLEKSIEFIINNIYLFRKETVLIGLHPIHQHPIYFTRTLFLKGTLQFIFIF